MNFNALLNHRIIIKSCMSALMVFIGF